MNKWFYFNLILLIFAVWKIADRIPLPLHILFGALGLMLVLFNWTRHAVFSTIRNTPDRQKKIKLAKISRKIVPFHRYIGSTALILIIIHATLVINRYGGFYWQNFKMISGILTGTVLICMVASGWLRLIWPSGRKRTVHIWLGLALFFMIAIHLVF